MAFTFGLSRGHVMKKGEVEKKKIQYIYKRIEEKNKDLGNKNICKRSSISQLSSRRLNLRCDAVG